MKVYPRDYFVPVVVKNRDYLVGFLNSLNNFSLGSSKFDFVLNESSVKFNDILPGGVRRREIDLEQQINLMIDYRLKMSVVEDVESIVDSEEDDKYLELNCECGNYVSFDSATDIPTHSYKCDICGKVLIDYTNTNDEDFIYDGDLENHIDFTDVLEMLIGDDDEDESSEEE